MIRPDTNPLHGKRVAGFTVVEILTVVLVTLFLGSLVFASYHGFLRRGAMATEISAARQCLAAYSLYAADNDGALIPGNPINATAYAKNGSLVRGVVARRYPWRLAPYVDYNLHGSILVNERRRHFIDPHDPSVQYELSVTPSFGLNSHCLGGFGPAYKTGLVARQGAMGGGDNLIVLTSAASVSGDELREGHHFVYGPLMEWMGWTGPADEKSPGNTGHVHFRHDKKAVVGHYAGHVTLKTEEELQDMRLWSMAAVQANDPNMTIPY
jgi:type II secretory pathway pseudopilin PulG